MGKSDVTGEGDSRATCVRRAIRFGARRAVVARVFVIRARRGKTRGVVSVNESYYITHRTRDDEVRKTCFPSHRPRVPNPPSVCPPRRPRGIARSASLRGVPTARRRTCPPRRGPGNARRRRRRRVSPRPHRDGARAACRAARAPARAVASRRSSTAGAKSLCASSERVRTTSPLRRLAGLSLIHI